MSKEIDNETFFRQLAAGMLTPDKRAALAQEVARRTVSVDAQPVPEPVAWIVMVRGQIAEHCQPFKTKDAARHYINTTLKILCNTSVYEIVAVYTHPQDAQAIRRKALMDAAAICDGNVAHHMLTGSMIEENAARDCGTDIRKLIDTEGKPCSKE